MSRSSSSGDGSSGGPAEAGTQSSGSLSKRVDAITRLRDELRALGSREPFGDNYRVLGVPPDTSIESVRNTFTSLAKRYHPERLPAELDDLRPLAARLLARWMAAYRAIADADRQTRAAAGNHQIGAQAAEARNVNRISAADALRRAEQLLKRDRLLLAEAQAALALELDPDNPRCIAIEAWVRALVPRPGANLLAILDSLDRALELDPMSVQTRFFRSELLKRLDRIDEAVAEWRLIVEIDPGHIDAQRELRLWELRRRSRRPTAQSSSGTHLRVSEPPAPLGLFGRLFRGSRGKGTG
jgi:tetratricopeptide (TPR) repeat protein